MKKRITSIVLILSIIISLLSSITVLAEENPQCLLPTPKSGEFFSDTTVFSVTVTDESDDPYLQIGLKGSVKGKPNCTITVYDSNGAPSKSVKDLWGANTRLYKCKIENGTASLSFSDFDKGASSQIEQKVSEKPDNISLPPIPLTDNHKPSYKIYIVAETTGGEAYIKGNTVCTINNLTAEDISIINYKIVPDYYGLIVSNGAYKNPEMVRAYINQASIEDRKAFDKYSSYVSSVIPKTTGEKIEFSILYETENFVDQILTLTANKLKDVLLAAARADAESAVDAVLKDDADDLLADLLSDVYIDLLKSIITTDVENVNDWNDSQTSPIEVTDKYKLAKTKSVAKIIKEVKAGQALNRELLEQPDDMSVEDYGKLIEKLDISANYNNGIKWWEFSDDFIANMLLMYDEKEHYIDALDAVFSTYCQNHTWQAAHKIAIERVRNLYNDSFVDSFIETVHMSDLEESAVKDFEKALLGEAKVFPTLTKVQLFIKIALKLTGISNKTKAMKQLMLSNGIYNATAKAMRLIEEKYDNIQILDDEMSTYACLYDLSKALRVYQLKSIRNNYVLGKKVNNDIDKKITEIKNMQITANVNTSQSTTAPTPAPTLKPTPTPVQITKDINGAGNTANDGFATSDGEYTYYSADGNLYRENIDGSHRQIILPKSGRRMKIDGEYLYYHRGGGLFAKYEDIYRIKKDGSSDEEHICSADFGFANSQIYNGYIFYVLDDKIIKQKLNGGDKKTIANTGFSFVIYNDRLYYNNDGTQEGLSSIDLDGNNYKYYNVGIALDINVVDDYIYYMSKNQIKRVPTDGGAEQMVCSNYGFTGYDIGINVYNGYVYFWGNDKLSRVSIDGSSLETSDLAIYSYICICNNRIYSTSADNATKMIISDMPQFYQFGTGSGNSSSGNGGFGGGSDGGRF